MANTKLKAEEKVVEPVKETKQEEPKASKPEKDPGIATLISVVGALLLAAPCLGYFYLNKVKKGIAWLVIGWVIVGFLVVFGSLCLFPLAFIPIYYLIVIWDVYLMAEGKEAKLPNILEEN